MLCPSQNKADLVHLAVLDHPDPQDPQETQVELDPLDLQVLRVMLDQPDQ